MVTLAQGIQIETLRPFPAAACKLIRLINDERVDFRDVSNVVAVDAAFSSQVLRLANSALIGSRYEITSILQALSVVGVDRLRDLVVTVALKDFMGVSSDACVRRCWRHNLATAFWCEKLAPRFDIEIPLGYTAGILHDIGRIALLMLIPQDYAAFLDQPRPGHLDPLEAERTYWKTDHCQIGHSLASAWHFPTVLRDVIAHHHDTLTNQSPRVRWLAQAACAAATISGFHTVNLQQFSEPKCLEDMLPAAAPGITLRFEDLSDTVARKVNETECNLS